MFNSLHIQPMYQSLNDTRRLVILASKLELKKKKKKTTYQGFRNA